MKAFYILCLSSFILLTACTTTKVTDVRYERGNLLKQETTPATLDKTEYELVIDRNSLKVYEKQTFVAKEIKIYEKIKSTQLNTKGKTMTDSPFWAIIGTPGALFLDAISLGTMGATAEIWTKNANEWNSIKDKLEDDFFVDETNQYSSKRFAVAKANVQVQINGEALQVLVTDAEGSADYQFTQLLYNSSIQPEQLISNQGVEVTAVFQGVNKSHKFSNKDIPEAYFARKFEDMKAVLSQRAGRFGNCEFIAKNKREFFECFYE